MTSNESDESREKINEHSKKLANLGSELSKIKFNYKLEKKPAKEYWEKRIIEFQTYKDTGIKYYNQGYLLMDIVNKDDAKLFLLEISKFHQLSLDMIDLMKKIKENPSIFDPKDKQQSQWSKNVKNQFVKSNEDCLKLEKDMNFLFREFYDKNLKNLIE